MLRQRIKDDVEDDSPLGSGRFSAAAVPKSNSLALKTNSYFKNKEFPFAGYLRLSYTARIVSVNSTRICTRRTLQLEA